jgi:hypothetical protein
MLLRLGVATTRMAAISSRNGALREEPARKMKEFRSLTRSMGDFSAFPWNRVATCLEHNPEKWLPGFRKDHA